MPTFYHGKGFRILVDAYDLSTYFSEATASYEIETAETTTFGNTSKSYVVGLADGTVSLSGFFDSTGAGSIEQVLQARRGVEEGTVLTLFPAGHATLGRRADLFVAHETSVETAGSIGDMVSLNADFQGSGTAHPGTILAPLAEQAAAVTHTAVDNGASTANGLVANLHVTANARAGASTFVVQHSVDAVTWVDLATFTSVAAGAITAQSVRTTGTVNRHLRAVSTGTGNATYVITAARVAASLS